MKDMSPLFKGKAWLLPLCLVAIVNAQQALPPPKNTCTAGDAFNGARCIRRQERRTESAGFVTSFCSSVLRISTPVVTQVTTSTNTVTIDSTTTTGTHTITEPMTTETVTKTNTLNSTSTETKTKTEITATFTSFSATRTTSSTSITYVYTCGGRSSSSIPVSSASVTASFPMTNSSSFVLGTGTAPPVTGIPPRPTLSTSSWPHGNLSSSASRWPGGTGTGIGTGRLPTAAYTPYVAKRQTQVFRKPPCVKHFQAEFGRNGLSSACQCFALPTPSATTTVVTIVDPSTTVTSTSTIQVEATTTLTPIKTKTGFTTTTTQQVTSTTTITTSTAKTVFGIFTRTDVTVSTSFTSLPTPSSFNIYYVDSAANESSPSNNFFHAVSAPGGSGVMLAPEAAADNFALDDQNRLMDLTDGGFLTKNTADIYPFEFLQAGATTLNTPICEACNGFLTCNYPGTVGNTFALCYGFLALGLPSAFGKDANGDGMVDCVAIALQYK